MLNKQYQSEIYQTTQINYTRYRNTCSAWIICMT
uniref:Uncharacterized protein n=1 Tax=Arundo donax TaxID=35708 RepID=A0A0A9GSL1_ARUDO